MNTRRGGFRRHWSAVFPPASSCPAELGWTCTGHVDNYIDFLIPCMSGVSLEENWSSLIFLNYVVMMYKLWSVVTLELKGCVAAHPPSALVKQRWAVSVTVCFLWPQCCSSKHSQMNIGLFYSVYVPSRFIWARPPNGRSCFPQLSLIPWILIGLSRRVCFISPETPDSLQSLISTQTTTFTVTADIFILSGNIHVAFKD